MSTPIEDRVRQVLAAEAVSAELPTADVIAAVRAQAATRRRHRRAYVGTGLAAAAAVCAVVALQPARQPAGPAAAPVAAAATTPAPFEPTGPALASTTDQERFDDLADRVHQITTEGGLKSLSALSVDANQQRVNLWWVGPIPAQLRSLAAQSTGARLVVTSGGYTDDVLMDTSERVMSTFFDRLRHPTWRIASVGPAPAGSGIEVGLVKPGDGVPELSAQQLVAVGAQIQQVAGGVPVARLFLTDQAVSTVGNAVEAPFGTTATMTAKPVAP